jgi:small subunit ribosomal protein S11
MAKVKKRNVQMGRAYIQSTFNNTIVTITDMEGAVIAAASAGACGFKGARKATPFSAQTKAESAVGKAKNFGVEKVHVYIKGIGSGREQAIRGLQAGGVNVESVTDVTPIPHNGCRPRKSRRV